MKIITWDTNVNGKLDCNRFAHVDLAPAKMPTLQELEQTLITIQVADKSHLPVVVKLDSIVPFPLTQLSNVHTWPSHGMDTATFIEMQHRKRPVSKETKFAVYYYKRVDVN